MTRWTPERSELAKKLWTETGYSASEIARALGGGISRNGVIGRLHMTERRFTDKPDLAPWAVRGLGASHPAMRGEPHAVPDHRGRRHGRHEERLLVSGEQQPQARQDGREGRFKGYALYGLSLEERATCPADCEARDSATATGCFARRHRIVDPEVFFDPEASKSRTSWRSTRAC
jgi:hypothetical protein